MLARDCFKTETPNVIDPGESRPSLPCRRNDEKRMAEGGKNSDNISRSRVLSSVSVGSTRNKYGLYTRKGNKGTLSKGIPIRIDLGDEYDDVNDIDDEYEDVVIFEKSSGYKGANPFKIENNASWETRSLENMNADRSLLDNEDDEEGNGIAQARLFAAAMLNESEKRQHSKRDLMIVNSDQKELSSTVRQMMNRASSFRIQSNSGNRIAMMASARASSFRNPNENHGSPMVNQSRNTKSNQKRSVDEKHLDNIWLVEGNQDVSKEGTSFKTNLLRKKLARTSIGLLVGTFVVIVFILAAVKSRYFFSPPGDANLSAAVAISGDPRLDRIVGFLTESTNISSVEEIYDLTSPQFKAAIWLAEEDSERLPVPSNTSLTEMDSATSLPSAVSPFDFVQRYVLLVLYFALGGNSSGNGWLNKYQFASRDRHECSWYERVLYPNTTYEHIGNTHFFAMGVACDRNLRVRGISLPANNLKGSIPSEIQYLSALNFLDLSDNFLAESIPEGLQHLTQLTHLDLSHNFLTGQISPVYWLSEQLIEMEYLDLSENLLILGERNTSHRRRHSLGGEVQLQTLALGGNVNNHDVVHGGNESSISIPDEIRYMTNLQTLSLDNCNIGGRIPPWLFHELNKLQLLDLSNNRLTGSIAGIFPIASEPSPLQHLKSLLLHDNKLTGTLPESMGLMPDLAIVTIHHTNITVGMSAANLICWGEEKVSGLESLTTDCGDITCPCCVADCCDGKDCFRGIDWHTHSQNNE